MPERDLTRMSVGFLLGRYRARAYQPPEAAATRDTERAFHRADKGRADELLRNPPRAQPDIGLEWLRVRDRHRPPANGADPPVAGSGLLEREPDSGLWLPQLHFPQES